VTPEKLRMIEASENVLKDFGFYDVRVRHHELGFKLQVESNKLSTDAAQPSTFNLQPVRVQHLARIEVGPAELPKLLENGLSVRVAEALKAIGYAHVTVDLQGYRRGSLNEQRPASTAGAESRGEGERGAGFVKREA